MTKKLNFKFKMRKREASKMNVKKIVNMKMVLMEICTLILHSKLTRMVYGKPTLRRKVLMEK